MGMAFPCCGVTTSFPCVLEFSAAFSLLLTGTPVQNSLQELYALLTLLEPAVFPREQAEEFVRRYQDVEREPQAGRWPGRRPRGQRVEVTEERGPGTRGRRRGGRDPHRIGVLAGSPRLSRLSAVHDSRYTIPPWGLFGSFLEETESVC